jgi:hypothetical protein
VRERLILILITMVTLWVYGYCLFTNVNFVFFF